MKPTVKLLFSANDIPVMKDKTGAVMRRLVIIPFKARFSKDDPDFDPYITWKLRDEKVMKYLILLGIQGLRRILENNAFTESKEVAEELKDFEMRNNPILLFLAETDEAEIVNQPCKEVFRAYKMFCVEKGLMEMTQPNFTRELNRRLNLATKRIRVNGDLVSIYVKKG
jgi:putative DNA primase/helicase